MPNIILSETSGRYKELYGEIAVPLASFIEERNEIDEKKCMSRFLFSERQSNSRTEGYGGLTATGLMENVGEGALPPENSYDVLPTKNIENEVFKSQIIITREMVEDAKGNMAQLAKNAHVAKLTSAYYRTRDNFLFGLLIAAASGKSAMTLGNKTYDTTAYDKKCLFHKSHEGGGNAFTDAFTADKLGALITRMQNAKDEKGTLLGIMPDTIVIPNEATIKKAVFAAIGAEKDPTVAGANGFNYLFGQFNVVVDPMLNALIGSSNTPWFVFDSQYNEMNNGNIFQNRKGLEITTDVDAAGNFVWDAYARFSGGFVDWRQIAGGGLTGSHAEAL